MFCRKNITQRFDVCKVKRRAADVFTKNVKIFLKKKLQSMLKKCFHSCEIIIISHNNTILHELPISQLWFLREISFPIIRPEESFLSSWNLLESSWFAFSRGHLFSCLNQRQSAFKSVKRWPCQVPKISNGTMTTDDKKEKWPYACNMRKKDRWWDRARNTKDSMIAT